MDLTRRKFLIPTGVACLLLVLHCAANTASAKDTWRAVQSKHFKLVGNASEKEIKQVASRLEQFREVFSHLFPELPLASPVPTTVVVFKSDSSFKPYKPVADGKTVVNVAGYFQSGRDQNYIALSAETGSEDPYRTIFHEYVHLLVNNTLGRAGVPPWFNEGLAEYYSSFEIQNGVKVTLGKPIPSHLYLLRSAKLYSLETLFSVDYYSLERNEHDSRGLFYAQSWALVHYLLQGNNAKRLPHLGKFLGLLRQNNPVERAFREAFQIDYLTLESELRQYIKQRSYRMSVATFEKKLEFNTEMQSAALTEAEGQAYLGDLLHHLRRYESAASKLQEALTLDPNLSMAHASLGMTRMEQKNFQDAKRHLAKAVECDSNNYLARYYYALVLSRERMDEQDRVSAYPAELAQLARAQLTRAIELKPDFAESYKLLAFINLVTEENLDDSLKLIGKAIALSPGNEEYLFILAQIYLRREEFMAARQTVEPLSISASDPQLRAQAEGFLKVIVSRQEQLAAYETDKANRASYRTSQNSERPTETQLEEELRLNPNAYLEEALRKTEAGESRLQGVLTRIDCNPKAILFSIKVGSRLYKFAANDFASIDITTFTPEVRGELTCGARKTADSIVVTYKPLPDARAKTDGIPVALEFVPNDFKLAHPNNTSQ